MALPQFTLRELLEAGVHFGHQTHRWNPKMSEYIYGSRNGIHIMDLQQTVPLMYRALSAIRAAASTGGRVLFVGSKRQAKDLIQETAERCGQYYINNRWLGGTLTNWKTITASIKRLKKLEENFANPENMAHLTKKEQLMAEREMKKLHTSLGGIKDMGGLPQIIVVIDTNREDLAIAEANKLGIPVVAILDSNCDPAGITYPIPGNDDAVRALSKYCALFSDAVLDGISDQMEKMQSRSETAVEMKRDNGGKQTTVKLSKAAAAAAEAADETTEEGVATSAKKTEEAATPAPAPKTEPATKAVNA